MAFPAGIVGGGEEPSEAPPAPQLPAPHRNHAVLGPKIRGSAASGGGNVQPVGRWRRRHFFSSMLGQMEQQNGGGEGGASGEEKQPEHPVIRWIKLIGPHVILYLSTMLYGLFGAMVFQRLERPFEVHHLQEHSEAVALAQQHFLRLKWAQQMNGTDAPEEAELELAVDNLIRLHMQAFEQGIRADELALAIEDFNAKQAMGFNGSAEDEESGGNRSPKWHFHSSLFFTATLLTSIGYGNLVPISPLGRLFCIGYAFLGIPLTLITIADIAKFLSERILNLSDWLEQNVFRRKRHGDERPIIQMDLKGDDDIILRQPGAYTKAFVLFLLFGYMWTMAALFSYSFQPGWGFLESLYFTLITLVTIGFGDYCPTLEGPTTSSQSAGSSAAFGWILFIFVGLILSTLTVDMVGSSYIERIHTLGRGFHLGSLLTMLKIGRGDAGPDSARLLRQLHAGAFIPADLKLIPYIDHIWSHNSQRPSADTILQQQQDNGNGPPNGQQRFSSAVSFLPDPTDLKTLVSQKRKIMNWERKASEKHLAENSGESGNGKE